MLRLLLIILIALSVHGQDFSFKHTIGNFKNASSFSISPSGIIYVADISTNEVYKLDSLGNVEKYIGGFGWNEASFDMPINVSASPLNIYVSDKNNHRIQRFDKDLNFISQLYTRDRSNRNEAFGYPLCSQISNLGDLYILDSENYRIIKFDLFGKYIANFGGFDDSYYPLTNPLGFTIGADNNIYVIDPPYLIIYDSFGNGLSKIEIDKSLININSNYSTIILSTNKKLYRYEITSNSLSSIDIAFPDNILNDIRDAVIFEKKLYVLTKSKILVYEKTVEPR